MQPDELRGLTLASAARLIRSKQLSPVELTRATLERIQSLNEKMATFITVTPDLAMEQAHRAEQAVADGRETGPLNGVPIALKDLIDTKGIRTTAGSSVFDDRVPDVDATVTTRLQEAGAVIVGKTNLHELAFGVTSVNPHYGTVRNPWDTNRIAGGSSGGSAAAIVMGMALGSLGSDTGGSIRIPAGLCGAVGFKPTYGRVPVRGVMPLSWSLDHVGPITRTVEDAAIMLGVIAGRDPLDPYSGDVPTARYSEQLEGGVGGLRIGLARRAFFRRLDTEVEAALEAAIDAFRDMGAELVEVDIPSSDQQRAIFNNIVCPEAFSFHEENLTRTPELIAEDVRLRIEAGRLMLSIDYVRAQRARTKVKRELQAALGIADVLVTPTLPIAAPRIDQTHVEWDDATEAVGPALTRNTRLFNVTGLPTVSLPCGFTDNDLPIGLQVTGRAFEEATVLGVAHSYERAAAWSTRRPDL